ncbi:MAG: helix-turn-helix domain-containing protein [Salinibacterium sp.]|nr:helix-turn-helix domain-containing protein [Salinibacterium sp.]
MSVLLDTRAVQPLDRPDYWAAGIAEHFFPMHIERILASSFEARLSGGQVGPVSVRSIRGLPHRVARTSRMIASADPECILVYFLRSGSVLLEQDGRSCALEPGDIAIQDTSRPSTFEGHSTFDVLVFALPKWYLEGQTGSIAQSTATRVAGAQVPLVRLAAPFLVGLGQAASGGGGLAGPEGEGAAAMLLSMVKSVYGDENTFDRQARSNALFARMQRYAVQHLHDPNLGPEQIARVHFVSTRYVHKLFAASGSGVSAWIRDRRLTGALLDVRGTDTPIAMVAARWGYRDPASFSRAFRTAYGRAPREVRAGEEGAR